MFLVFNFKTFFSDNIDTRTVLESIRELVSRSNVYLDGNRGTSQALNRQLLKNVAAYITNIFDVLGVIARPEEVGFPAGGEQAANVSFFISA